MPIVVTTPPAKEPVSLQEAKDQSRVTHDREDSKFLNLIKAAREKVEADTGRALITQTVKQYRDAFPCGLEILLEKSPIQSIVAITYIDSNGATQTLSATVYALKNACLPARAVLKDNQSWPTDISQMRDAVCIESIAGEGDEPSDVPAVLRQAILFLTDWWYQQPSPVLIGPGAAPLPHTYEALVGQKRIYLPRTP